jgi:hypothetical protein
MRKQHAFFCPPGHLRRAAPFPLDQSLVQNRLQVGLARQPFSIGLPSGQVEIGFREADRYLS